MANSEITEKYFKKLAIAFTLWYTEKNEVMRYDSL